CPQLIFHMSRYSSSHLNSAVETIIALHYSRERTSILRPFFVLQRIGLTEVPALWSPSRIRNALFLLILYYLPPLLLLLPVLPFTWRFQILASMTVVMLVYDC